MKKQPSIKELKARVKSGEISLDDANAILAPREDAFFKKYGQERLAECEPTPIDDILVGMIEDGSVELTDARFFELLKETPAYLRTKPFQNKIAQWQWMLGNSLLSDQAGKKEQRTAQKNLQKIGKTLAYEGQGRPEKIPDIYLYQKCLQYIRLAESVKVSGDKHDAEPINFLPTFIRQHPEYARHFNLKAGRRYRSPKEIAIKIVAKENGVSERTVRAAIATCAAARARTPSISTEKLSE